MASHRALFLHEGLNKTFRYNFNSWHSNSKETYFITKETYYVTKATYYLDSEAVRGDSVSCSYKLHGTGNTAAGHSRLSICSEH